MVTIGFDSEKYAVTESDRFVVLIVRLIEGVLQRDILVHFKTAAGTATSTGSLILL